MTKMTKAELVAAVKKHASENYEREGWDYVVECWADSDIADTIGKASTLDGAIRNVKRIIGILNERRQAVVNEAF